MIRCLFEQSGTFKNEFKKLGYDAEDYDILNDYGQTDHIIDIFYEIENFEKYKTIFDDFKKDDLVLAFFPCVRFSEQFILTIRQKYFRNEKTSDMQKIFNSMNYNDEINLFYKKLCKLCIIAYKKGFKLMIENPYGKQHYLTRYFPIEPKIIDYDRRDNGDFFKKPTQYFIINFEPKENWIFEPITWKETKTIENTHGKERSEISPEYANRFIRRFLID